MRVLEEALLSLITGLLAIGAVAGFVWLFIIVPVHCTVVMGAILIGAPVGWLLREAWKDWPRGRATK